MSIFKKAYNFVKAYLRCDFDTCGLPKSAVKYREKSDQNKKEVNNAIEKIQKQSRDNLERTEKLIATIDGDPQWFAVLGSKKASDNCRLEQNGAENHG